MAAAVARSVAAAVAVSACAELTDLKRTRPRKCSENLCEEERLALDRRGEDSHSLGGEGDRITKPLRKELILMSSVIC